jgi:hypothetical protein
MSPGRTYCLLAIQNGGWPTKFLSLQIYPNSFSSDDQPGRVVRKRVSNPITFAQKIQDLTIMINTIAPLDDSMIEDHMWIEKLGHVFSFYSHSLKLGTAPDHLLYLHQFWFSCRYFYCSNAACFPKWRPAFQNGGGLLSKMAVCFPKCLMPASVGIT